MITVSFLFVSRLLAVIFQDITQIQRHTKLELCFTIVFYYFLTFQNKKFVYRGLEYERISAFTQRLMSEYPSTQLLTKMGPPPEAILKSNQQCKLISTIIIGKTNAKIKGTKT